MYRVALESILGLQFNEDAILLNPVIGSHWEGYSIALLLDDQATRYDIRISNPNRLQSGLLQGQIDDQEVQFATAPARIRLNKDRQAHRIELHLTIGTSGFDGNHR
jgi:cellobiose phosphorylase